jgi:hypothetical protein
MHNPTTLAATKVKYHRFSHQPAPDRQMKVVDVDIILMKTVDVDIILMKLLM